MEGSFSVGRKWLSSKDDMPSDNEIKWKNRTKVSLTLFRQYWKQNGLSLVSKMARPHSAVLSLWGVRYRLLWCEHRLKMIDDVMFQQSRMQIATPLELQNLELVRFEDAWQLAR